MSYKDIYNSWIKDSYFDECTRNELLSIKSDEREIEERFCRNLEFGTAGLRGIIGAGTNRMNVYTVRRATQGFANYILGKKGAKDKGVVIAYDSRRMSPEFALETALVFNGNGIKTYLFEDLRPVPMLSFAVRRLKAAGGVVITASHNPPEYNGYKVYGEDGAQVAFPVDLAIISEVNGIEDFQSIKISNRLDAKAAGLFNIIDKEVDDEYIKEVTAQLVDAETVKNTQKDLKIVYTPLHGSGNMPVQRVLKAAGFENVHTVAEQEAPDPDFTTVKSPNPEDPKAFELGIKLANELGADIVIGTDPDADRVGAAIREKDGKYSFLTGNMTGLLIAEYTLAGLKKADRLNPKSTVISSVVSTKSVQKMTGAYGVQYIEVLTGFKYIGEKIKEFEETGSNEFIFGFEESYGCLKGTYARDKDAVSASMLLCELAAYYKSRNMTLIDGLEEIYKKYGYAKEHVVSITLAGLDGLAKIEEIMKTLRKTEKLIIGGKETVEFRDYSAGTRKNMVNDKIEKMNLPKADVLYYILSDSTWICVRPSGTEPKIKVYFGVTGTDSNDADKKLDKARTAMMKFIEGI
ncbi:MAG: phospho-sugar mutase [Defluviitaleaceae bacterium]|nr:phospho-sugar mutase [Defluviitaleaceae bacterium]